jgi:flagellar assembly protein FliH
MGAPDNKLFSKLIPREQLSDAESWQFEPLHGARGETLHAQRDARAFERGLAQGRREGFAAASAQRAQHAQSIARVLDELRGRFAELESAGADALFDLAIEIARQVVRHEVRVRRDAVLPVLREAVTQVIEQQAHPRVHLNPRDLELIRADLDADGLLKGCRFVPDTQVGQGGCRVETNLGEIDGRLATRWRRVVQQTLGADAAWTEADDEGAGAGTR